MPLIHPRMLEKLEMSFFPQRCALKEPSTSQDSVGQEISTHNVHVGYESIPCRVGVAGGGQRRGNQQTYLEATHRIVLAGQYPDLPEAWREGEEWIAEVDGVEYKILMVGNSAEAATTRLETRIIA